MWFRVAVVMRGAFLSISVSLLCGTSMANESFTASSDNSDVYPRYLPRK